MIPDPVVDRGVGGTGIETHKLTRTAPPGDIADSAKIEDCGLGPEAMSVKQGGMIDRAERRPLAAFCHIGAAKVVNNLPSCARCHQCAVTKLPCVSCFVHCRGAMEDCLAVKSDGGDVGHVDPARSHKFDHSIRLDNCGLCFQFAEDCRFEAVKVPCRCRLDTFGKALSQPIRIGNHSGRPEFGDVMAVGPDQRDVDFAVKGGAGHQTGKPAWLAHGSVLQWWTAMFRW